MFGLLLVGFFIASKRHLLSESVSFVSPLIWVVSVMYYPVLRRLLLAVTCAAPETVYNPFDVDEDLSRARWVTEPSTICYTGGPAALIVFSWVFLIAFLLLPWLVFFAVRSVGEEVGSPQATQRFGVLFQTVEEGRWLTFPFLLIGVSIFAVLEVALWDFPRFRSLALMFLKAALGIWIMVVRPFQWNVEIILGALTCFAGAMGGVLAFAAAEDVGGDGSDSISTLAVLVGTVTCLCLGVWGILLIVVLSGGSFGTFSSAGRGKKTAQTTERTFASAAEWTPSPSHPEPLTPKVVPSSTSTPTAAAVEAMKDGATPTSGKRPIAFPSTTSAASLRSRKASAVSKGPSRANSLVPAHRGDVNIGPSTLRTMGVDAHNQNDDQSQGARTLDWLRATQGRLAQFVDPSSEPSTPTRLRARRRGFQVDTDGSEDSSGDVEASGSRRRSRRKSSRDRMEGLPRHASVSTGQVQRKASHSNASPLAAQSHSQGDVSPRRQSQRRRRTVTVGANAAAVVPPDTPPSPSGVKGNSASPFAAPNTPRRRKKTRRPVDTSNAI